MAGIKKLGRKLAKYQMEYDGLYKEHLILTHARLSAYDYSTHNETKSRDEAHQLLPEIDSRLAKLSIVLDGIRFNIRFLQDEIQWYKDGCPDTQGLEVSMAWGHLDG